ncbi:MAG TPA: hypothetical protein VK171_13965 [Fimbriimonas sp.]|nr:hypothetical protein [Fimbriimonas sp.]
MKAILIPLGLILLFGSGLLIAQPKRSPAALVVLTSAGILVLALGFTNGLLKVGVLAVLVLLLVLGVVGWRIRK